MVTLLKSRSAVGEDQLKFKPGHRNHKRALKGRGEGM